MCLVLVGGGGEGEVAGSGTPFCFFLSSMFAMACCQQKLVQNMCGRLQNRMPPFFLACLLEDTETETLSSQSATTPALSSTCLSPPVTVIPPCHVSALPASQKGEGGCVLSNQPEGISSLPAHSSLLQPLSHQTSILSPVTQPENIYMPAMPFCL